MYKLDLMRTPVAPLRKARAIDWTKSFPNKNQSAHQNRNTANGKIFFEEEV